jgi:transposase
MGYLRNDRNYYFWREIKMNRDVKMITKELWVKMRNLYANGLKISTIARELGCNRKTVAKYIKSSSPPKYEISRPRRSKLKPYEGFILSKLKEYPYTAAKLYELIKEQGYTGGRTILQDFVRKIKKENKERAVIRFETLPGQQGQVDWLEIGRIPIGTKKIKLSAFVMTLGYSRTRYAEFTKDMSLNTFLQCHINSFKYFGGVPKEILYDNIGTVVIQRVFSTGKSKFNQRFLDFAGYYSFTPILCKPGKARTKGKVESTIKFIEYNFLMGLKFRSLKHINTLCINWLDRVNSEISQATNERPFERLKQENLMPLNIPDYSVFETVKRRVPKDCLISFESNRYSVPPEYIGKTVLIKKLPENTIKIYYQNEFICAHRISDGRGNIVYLPEHRAKIYKISCKCPRKRPRTKVQKFLDLSQVGEFPDVEKRQLDYYTNLGG